MGYCSMLSMVRIIVVLFIINYQLAQFVCVVVILAQNRLPMV